MIDRQKVLQRLMAELAKGFGPRFQGLILCGSEAKGEARGDHDEAFGVRRHMALPPLIADG